MYFPACINRIFGNSRSSTRTLSLPQALVAVSARAGLPLWIPDDVAGTCCITVWHSKGYVEAARFMAERTADRFWVWSDGGRLPIIVDATSCTLGAGRELTASATAREAEEVAAAGCSVHVSANRTCEVGMEQATGSMYESVVFALEVATRP